MQVTWGQLGCPTQPGTYEVGGILVVVAFKDIDVAEGRSDAEFSLTRFVPFVEGRPRYVLGSVCFPEDG